MLGYSDQMAADAYKAASLYIYSALAAVLLSVLIVLMGENIYFLPLMIIALLIFFYALQNTLFWICIAILLHFGLFVEESEGISLYEIAFAVFVYVPLTVWFVRRILTGEEKLISSFSDYLFIAFFSVATLSIFTSLLSGNPLLKWVREYLVLFEYLLYFPIKSEIAANRKKALTVVALSFLCLGVVIGIRHFVNYLIATRSIVYFFEIISRRQASSEAVVIGLVLASTSMYFIAGGKVFQRGLYILLSVFSVLALIFTFTRADWISAVLAMLVVFIAATRAEKKRIARQSVFFTVVVFAILFIFFGRLAVSIIEAVSVRLALSNANDPSLHNRFVEAGAMWEAIKKSPVLGYGLGHSYFSRDAILGFSRLSAYGHNSYLYLWMKLGIIGLLSYLATLSMKVKECAAYLRDTHLSGGERAALLASLGFMVSTYFLALSGSAFYQKDAVFVYALCWGIIGGLNPQLSQERDVLR